MIHSPFLMHYILRVTIIAFKDDVVVPLRDRSQIIQEVLTSNRFFKVSSTLDLRLLLLALSRIHSTAYRRSSAPLGFENRSLD